MRTRTCLEGIERYCLPTGRESRRLDNDFHRKVAKDAKDAKMSDFFSLLLTPEE
jgi:hypothetical protein